MRKTLDLISSLNVIMFTFILLFFGLIKDDLFFHNNIFSLIHFTEGVTILLLVVVIPLALLYQKIFHRELQTNLILIRTLFFSVIFFVFDLLTHGLKKLQYRYLAILAILFVLAIWLCIKATEKAAAKNIIDFKRLSLFQKIVSSLLVIIFLTGYFSLFQKKPLEKNTKNLIMIVIDGMPVEFLQLFNKKYINLGIQDFASKSKTYLNMRTNYVYTWGFFRTLYTGQKSEKFKSSQNIFNLIESNGYNTRYSVFHTNGVPDSTKVFDYRAFRSELLSQNYTWLPKLLHLNYGVLRYQGYVSSAKLNIRIRNLHYLMNRYYTLTNILENHLVDQVEEMRSKDKPFFLLMHTNTYANIPSIDANEPWANQFQPVQTADTKYIEFFDMNGYQYSKEYTALIDKWRVREAGRLDQALTSAGKFFKIFQDHGWDKDTDLILTTDHGCMYTKGKVFYGRHNDEEVARVPLLYFDGSPGSENHELYSSIDITKTILDHFQVKTDFMPTATSLLDPKGAPYATTTTIRNTLKNNVQYLNIYKNGFKYVVNLFDNDYTLEKYHVDGFDSNLISKGDQLMSEITPELFNQTLKDYGLKNPRK